MAKNKEKKPLTTKDKIKRFRIKQYSAVGGEFVSILTPFIAMGIANYDEWFKTTDGWKVGLGGSLALALLGIAVFLVTKKKEDKEITNGFITLIIGWFAVAFIFLLLGSIMDQMATIMFFGGLGLLGALGLDFYSTQNRTQAELYLEALKKVKGEKLEEDIKKEIEEEVKKEQAKEKKQVPVD